MAGLIGKKGRNSGRGKAQPRRGIDGTESTEARPR